MTRKRKKTTIITETDRMVIINRHGKTVTGWSNDCNEEAGTSNPDPALASAIFRIGSVYRSLAGTSWRAVKPELFEDYLDPWPKPA